MLDYLRIGQRIRAIRRMQNLSQEQLAERVWISVTHMSHIETGTTKLSLPVLVDIANALGVGADELLMTELLEKKRLAEVQIQSILSQCTQQQAQVLSDILAAAKQSMDSNL